jgi:endoglucanase
MKKRIFAIALAAAMLLAFIPARAQAQPFTPVTGEEMMQRLGLGMNFGNTMDANPLMDAHYAHLPDNLVDMEISWYQPRIEQWHIQAIAARGFDHLRLPITWENHIMPDGSIYAPWLRRVQQVVDWALDAGLYVVINTHHERGTPDSFYQLIDTGRMAEAGAWLTNVWTQIAAHFRDYDHRLLFEPMNEPHRQVQGGWIWYPFPNVDQILVNNVNALNQLALDTIRASGGNNDRRVVMLTTAGANVDAIPYHIHPDDPYTMLGVFFYGNDLFDNIAAARAAGIPVYIKETAPLYILGDGTHDPQAQLAWAIETYTRTAEMGIPIAWWNIPGVTIEDGWNLFDVTTNQWGTPLVDALFAAYGRTPGPAIPAPAPNFPIELQWGGNVGDFYFWMLTYAGAVHAEYLVVEHTGLTGNYTFVRFNPAPWTEFHRGDARITEEPGRIIFNLGGLSGNQIGFVPWYAPASITRVFLTSHQQLGVVQAASGWAQPYVTTALINRLLPANLQSNFTAATTRLEFAQLAVLLYESATGRTIPAGASPFSDTTDVNAIKAYNIGVVGGMGDGTFAPAGTLTRAQAAAMMSRLASAIGSPLPQHAPTFIDTGDFPTWATAYIGQMQASNIMGGMPDGSFAPTGDYTREQSIITIVRLFNLLN